MPELPDVEGFRAHLARQLARRKIREVQVHDAGVLRNTTAQVFVAHLIGHRFAAAERHGKWLLLPTDGPTLIVHSGMTGRPHYSAAGAQGDRFERVRIVLDRGEFRYDDLRKLRGLWLADDDEQLNRIVGKSGPDALDVQRAEFATMLSTRGRLKTRLTDQSVIAGLGNLLADEISWQARVHPLRDCRSLDPGEVDTLYTTMRRVLRTSIRHECVPSLRNWLTRVRGDRDARCPRCGAALDRARNAGRMTVWCPAEQRP